MPKDNLQAPRVSTGMRSKLIAPEGEWYHTEASKMEDVRSVRSVELEDTRWV